MEAVNKVFEKQAKAVSESFEEKRTSKTPSVLCAHRVHRFRPNESKRISVPPPPFVQLPLFPKRMHVTLNGAWDIPTKHHNQKNFGSEQIKYDAVHLNDVI